MGQIYQDDCWNILVRRVSLC